MPLAPSSVNRIAILPLDDRPVNYIYPQVLARAAGVEVLMPEREWLGNLWRPAQATMLADWLLDTAAKVDAVVLAADTLAYGGLVNSRTSAASLDEAQQRLAILHDMKATNPQLQIVASSVIQRITRANTSEEEMPYWATYGSRMFRLSYLEHKGSVFEASNAEKLECSAIKATVPLEIYADYMKIRARNHAINNLMLDWTADGMLDYLLLPQDDTADYGWNIREARHLQSEIRKRGLTDRAITYPGADEIGCLLLARILCQSVSFAPRVFARYSSSLSPSIITEYEDRPIHELIKAHLAPLSGILVDTPEQADITLFVNAPALKQGAGEFQWLVRLGIDALGEYLPDAMKSYATTVSSDPILVNTRREMETPKRSPEEFCRAILAAIRDGQTVALADVAFVNGSDLILGEHLVHHPEIAQLAAYGGWNTAGNTLGAVLAQAVLRVLALRDGASREQEQAHHEFLFLRFLDDYAYQAIERTRCMVEDLPKLGHAPSYHQLPDSIVEVAQAEAEKRLMAQTTMLKKAWIQAGLVKDIQLSRVVLPWRRLFEIECDLEVSVP